MSDSKRSFHRKASDGGVSEVQSESYNAVIPVGLEHNRDTLNQSFDNVNKLVADAIVLRKKGKDDEARLKLIKAVETLDSIIRALPKSSTKRQQLIFGRKKYKEAIDELGEDIDRDNATPEINKVFRQFENNNRVGQEEQTGSSFYKDQIAIVKKEDLESFPDLDDVIGLDDVKDQISFDFDFHLNKEIKRKYPDLGEIMSGSRSILMYGPSGNGKTELARAIAKEKNINFIAVQPSDIFSKYLGESNKFLKAIFEKARENQPSIIFIDEIDSIASKRNSNENESTRRVKSEFLTLMEGFGKKKDEKVWVLGATNLPFDLDSAVLRRFPPTRQFYIGNPDQDAKVKLLKSKLEKDLPKSQKIADDVDYNKIALMLEDYSGSDITSIAQAVRERPSRELFKQVNKPSTEGPTKLRAIELQDFEDAIISTQPTTDKRDVERLKAWGERNKKKLRT